VDTLSDAWIQGNGEPNHKVFFLGDGSGAETATIYIGQAQGAEQPIIEFKDHTCDPDDDPLRFSSIKGLLEYLAREGLPLLHIAHQVRKNVQTAVTAQNLLGISCFN